MAEIKPLKALVYNPQKVNLAQVICPPYDIISPKGQQYYHDLDPANLIHIILRKEQGAEDKYKAAGAQFRQWIKEGVLIQEQSPAIYFYGQHYSLRREKKTRYGFIALLKLPENDKTVYSHEHTRQEPKEDRYKLIKEVQANLSPIFVIFEDKKRIIQRTLKEQITGRGPFIEIKDDDQVLHQLWRLDNAEEIDAIQKSMLAENIFIADGHHRFEVACAFRDQMRRSIPDFSGQEGFNYVMAYFTNSDSRGLTIMPTHRLVKMDRQEGLKQVLERIGSHFYIHEIKDKTKFLFLMEKGGRSEHVLGMYKDKSYWLLRLKNIKILDKIMPDKPAEYRAIDAAILNSLILKDIPGQVSYIQEPEELTSRVDAEPGYVAFFLNPVRIGQIMAVALKGERMPPKSTYFYPKVVSGLVMHKFEG